MKVLFSFKESYYNTKKIIKYNRYWKKYIVVQHFTNYIYFTSACNCGAQWAKVREL